MLHLRGPKTTGRGIGDDGERAERAEREFGHLSLYEKRKKEREGGRKEGRKRLPELPRILCSGGRQYAKCARRSTFECVSD